MEDDKELELAIRILSDRDAKGSSVRARIVEFKPREGGGFAGEVETRDGRRHEVVFHAIRGALGIAAVERVARVAARTGEHALLLAQAVGPKLREAIIARGLGYLDLAGNCHLDLADAGVTVSVEGRRSKRTVESVSALRGAGYRVLFALLADGELLTRTVRELGAAANCSRHAAQSLLARLRDEGVLIRAGRSAHVFAPGGHEQCIDRFATGWADVLRSAQTVGRFRLREQEPDAIARRIEQQFHSAQVPFGFGGARACGRWIRYLPGDDLTIHVDGWGADVERQLGAIADRSGPLLVFHTMTKLDLNSGFDDTAHPLLVHAELARSSDPRSREAAGLLLEHMNGEPR